MLSVDFQCQVSISEVQSLMGVGSAIALQYSLLLESGLTLDCLIDPLDSQLCLSNSGCRINGWQAVISVGSLENPSLGRL